MKHQYVGDINDYRKYALLRALSANGTNRIGVCWMLTPSDGSMDGNKLSYLAKPGQHRHFDPELFDILAHAAAEPDRRRLQTIEDSGAIPEATYYNTMLPHEAEQRAHYMADCRMTLAKANLVFFDPDNGIEVASSQRGLRRSQKHVFLDELEAFYKEGKSILIYQHFPRRQRRDIVIATRVQQLRGFAGDAAIWLFRTSDVVFFLLVHPESAARIAIAGMEASAAWRDGASIHSEYLTGASLPGLRIGGNSHALHSS